jgi:hypothetical protein
MMLGPMFSNFRFLRRDDFSISALFSSPSIISLAGVAGGTWAKDKKGSSKRRLEKIVFMGQFYKRGSR